MHQPLLIRAVTFGVALVVLLTPARVFAWGFEAHQFIVERAIARLPQEIRPFFEAYRSTFIERSIDPDTWREAGFSGLESAHHFFHADWKGYGADPRLGILRDHDAAVARWGTRQVDRNGTLPWRTEEMYGRLKEAFAAYADRGAFGRFDVLFFSAWLAHYASDAYVPFHAVEDYDGQSTGQAGIHARFESLLFERYRASLTVSPPPLAPVHDPGGAVFDAVIDGARLVPTVLAADRQARDRREDYDQAYWDAFYKASGPLLEQRLADSVALVAAMITGAWEEAGRPDLPLRTAAPRR
jgi:hypothetical protein